MKSNKPIQKTITIEGEDKVINLDRLCIQMNVTPKAGLNSPITQAVLIDFKKCSENGWIFNDGEERMFVDDIAKCEDIDILTCFAKIDAALTELVNKKGF